MDHSLLRSWLGLPQGSWPPDHYSLLGLSPEEFEPASVEQVVLGRMGRLRQHQLLHPDLVTEGMNRLAQALICLTDPNARAAYDVELGLSPKGALPEPEVVRPALLPTEVPGEGPIPGFPIPTEEAPFDSRPGGRGLTEIPFEPGMGPPGHPSRKSTSKATKSSVVVPYEVIWEPDVAPPTPPGGVVEAELLALPTRVWKPSTRRELFKRLALARRYLEAWQKLKSTLANPHENLEKPMQVLTLLQGAGELRPMVGSFEGVLGEFGRPGGLVAAIVRHPLTLNTVRTLLEEQRIAVAIDWRRGELALHQELSRLRELMRSGRALRRRSRFRLQLARQIGKWFVQMPELVLVVILLVGLLWLLAGPLVHSPSGKGFHR